MALPVLVSAIVGGLVSAAGTLVGRVLVSLGIGMVVFTGIDASITWARDAAISSLQGLPGNALRVAGVLKIGTAISILSSALLARMTLQGLTGGTLKKWVNK